MQEYLAPAGRLNRFLNMMNCQLKDWHNNKNELNSHPFTRRLYILILTNGLN
jgi:hypothetical protein